MKTANTITKSTAKKTTIKAMAITAMTAIAVGVAVAIPSTPMFGKTSNITISKEALMSGKKATSIKDATAEEVVDEIATDNTDISGGPILNPLSDTGRGTAQLGATDEIPTSEMPVEQPVETVDEQVIEELVADVTCEVVEEPVVTEEQVYYEEQPVYEWQESEETYWVEENNPAIPDAVEGDAGMTGEELTMAHDIFDRYNEWRMSRGLTPANWDGTCAEMAMGSARGCAERRNLVHRLGIPVECQTSYSDILQYASWPMSGEEAVQRWENSDGHRAQMLCQTVQNGACGVYKENGIYWFAIVYTFQGNNRG